MQLITPEITKAAIATVHAGDVISLNAPIELFDPPLFGRSRLEIEFRENRGGRGLDDIYHGYNPQSGSQWDSLGHVAYRLDAYYNGAKLTEVTDGQRDTIASWGERGIATRGVLLDLVESAKSGSTPYDPGTSHAFTVDELERARVKGGVTYREGDIMVIHTGFIDWYRSLGDADRSRVATHDGLTACGIEHTEAMAEYLWNSGVVAVVSDAPSLEVWPMDHSDELFPFGLLHQVLIAQFGMGIGELWETGPLARACAAAGRSEFLLTSAPFNSRGISSPANALAIL